MRVRESLAYRFLHLFLAVTDWFVPAEVLEGDADRCRRARLAVTYGEVLVVLGCIYIAVFFLTGCPRSGISLTVGTTVIFGSLFAMRWTGSNMLVGNLIALGFFAGLTGVICHQGGHGSLALPWYANIPVVALLASRRSAVIWLFTTLLTLILFYVLSVNGVAFPMEPGPRMFQFLGLVAWLGLISIIFGLALMYELSMSRAIVGLRNAENRLLREKNISDSLIASLPGVFYLYDSQGKFLRWNENLNRVTGYTSEELVATHPVRLFRKQDKDSLDRLAAEVFSNGQATVEAFFLAKDDTKIPYLFSAKRVLIDGKPCLIGTGIDITERKQAERAHQLNELRLETLIALNQLTEASFTDITNFGLEQAVRVTESEMGYLAFLSEDESSWTIQAWSNNAMTECAMTEKQFVYPVASLGLLGEAVRQRKPIVSNDYAAPNPLKKGCPVGHAPIHRHMNVPIFDGDRIVIVVGVANKETPYDASDVRQLTLLIQGVWQLIMRNRATEELRESQKQLELYAADLETTNSALAESTRLAEASTHAKSEFLANMSHEIRTPLTAILGYADLLLSEEDIERAPKHRRQAFETIHRNGEHLLKVINGILDMAKVEAGRMEIHRVRCSPFAVMDEIVSLMRVRADAKQLSLRCDVVGSLPETVLTDPLRLRQVLINLVGNAIKFTDHGEVRITARLVRDGDRPRLQLDVADTGIGMSKSQVEDLFQPFGQVDGSAARRFGGTGLGLCLSKWFVEALGGTIDVQSEPDQGSTFSITIDPGNLNGIRMVEHGPEQVIEAVASSRTIELHGRILLAEDGLDNQRLISLLLKQAGAEVSVVENGRYAVTQALSAWTDERPFDVILMDMQMPEMDGYEAARILRNQGYSGPIIALTAHAMVEDRQRCLDAGCNDYATKPIDRLSLLAMVAHWAAQVPISTDSPQNEPHPNALSQARPR